MHRLTKGTALVGDLLLDGAKLEKVVKIRLGTGGTATGTSQTVTPYVLPTQAEIYYAFVNILTASTGATKTFSVGTSGTASGFLLSVSAASTGLVRPNITTATSGGNTGGFMLVSNTFGSLLMSFSSGSTAVGDAGFNLTKTYLSDSNASRTITFTPNSSEWSAFSADLYIVLTDVTR